jgi:hypothetical protein
MNAQHPEMNAQHPEASPTVRGRILAALYLVVVVCGIVGQAVIADSFVTANDAGATAANIRDNPALYRLAFTIFMVEMIAQVVTSLLFYDLLKPVNRSVARIAAVVGITGAGIKTFARLFYYAPLILLGGAPYLSALGPSQLDAWSQVFIRLNSQGAAIALIFFGVESILGGWLVYRSGFLPRFLGVLSMIGGLGWLTYLWPPLGNQAFMFVALFALVGLTVKIGWLFIRGVDDARWRERAAVASGSIWR